MNKRRQLPKRSGMDTSRAKQPNFGVRCQMCYQIAGKVLPCFLPDDHEGLHVFAIDASTLNTIVVIINKYERLIAKLNGLDAEKMVLPPVPATGVVLEKRGGLRVRNSGGLGDVPKAQANARIVDLASRRPVRAKDDE